MNSSLSYCTKWAESYPKRLRHNSRTSHGVSLSHCADRNSVQTTEIQYKLADKLSDRRK
ncbi:MAG: hypothetical protein LH631_08375 [Alkalinema sp. CAN_BIN05]|nr:hypothetical protein [Alkalinema sp. CAN_BIN05]